LRWGEAIALRRCDIDLEAATVSIRRQYIELATGHQIGPPKSRAGTRTVAIPAAVVQAVQEHLNAYVAADGATLVFTGPLGRILRRGNFRRDTRWHAAVTAIGVPDLHFHDLRHTGNTLAARDGTSVADLKARM
jgi:integrase